ncbi:hypothetical protein BD779DRAFT_1611012 [Infundibulicybe gibba]|nr:hypothetical protein BD779DRAFT_1611012 [Infundibulicybe gibba]
MPSQSLHHEKQPKQQGKPHHIESLSGPAPQSHPGVAEAASPKRASLTITDVFVCVGGVNIATLLRASRGSLIEQAEAMGANALVDELWKCTISSPKQRSNGTFRVQIRYTAQATRSTAPDPHKPVALSSARGVPGLMTILRRTH